MLKTLLASLVCISLLLLLSCEKVEDAVEEEGLQTTPPPKKTLAANLVADLRTNLKDLSKSAPKSSPKSSPKLNLISSTTELTEAQLDTIINAALKAVKDAGLTNSNDLNALTAVIIQAAESSLAGLNLDESSFTNLVIGGIVVSLESSIEENQQHLDTSTTAGETTTAINILLNDIAETAISYLDETGLTAEEVQEGANYVVSAIVANVDEVGINEEALANAINSITAGAVEGLDEIELEGYDSTDLGDMVQGITA